MLSLASSLLPPAHLMQQAAYAQQPQQQRHQQPSPQPQPQPQPPGAGRRSSGSGALLALSFSASPPCSSSLPPASSSPSSASPSSVLETVTVSTLTCLIEKQYTIRKTESDRLPELERKALIPVHVRILKEKRRTAAGSEAAEAQQPPALNAPSSARVGVKRDREEEEELAELRRSPSSLSEPYLSPAGSPSLSSSPSSPRPQSPLLFIPATDIGPLLNIRKNNIPGYISKYDSALRQQMMVDCPRAAGGVARVQLNVLTVAGAEKFILTSRSKQADKVWDWIQQHVTKISQGEQQQQHQQQQQQQQQLACSSSVAGVRLLPAAVSGSCSSSAALLSPASSASSSRCSSPNGFRYGLAAQLSG